MKKYVVQVVVDGELKVTVDAQNAEEARWAAEQKIAEMEYYQGQTYICARQPQVVPQ